MDVDYRDFVSRVQCSRTICAMLVKGTMKSIFCEIILNLDQLFGSGGPFVGQSGTICAIWVEAS